MACSLFHAAPIIIPVHNVATCPIFIESINCSAGNGTLSNRCNWTNEIFISEHPRVDVDVLGSGWLDGEDGKAAFSPTFSELSPNGRRKEERKEGRKRGEERGGKVRQKIAGHHFSVADKRFGSVKSRYDRVYDGDLWSNVKGIVLNSGDHCLKPDICKRVAPKGFTVDRLKEKG
ncbi:hypothetical protein K0M31_010750 [Melipona bicolor]|uniref:Uncharacterized protein n=1 Tax=Melipona bicolor TaxID=60889 RepID=A0AA40FLJ4_9HYME|nr:hypothetical protein K0M31_010750 [Melipona bicolor]